MTTIVADSADAERELQTLVKLISEGGGGLHSNLIIHSEGSILRVETKDPMDSGKEIIRLSREVLLPSDQYIFGAKDDQFTVEFPSQSNFSVLQKKLMETMVAIYNLGDKAKDYKGESFMLFVMNYPDLLALFKRGRKFPEDFQQSIDKLVDNDFSDDAFNGFISRGFFKTRVLGYNDYIRESKVSILMPVIDFLNHHWSGAGFNVVSGARVRLGDLVLQNRQPVSGSRECYAFYGVMDAFDSLVRYNFVDTLSPFISSVPIDIDVSGIGTLRIEGAMGAVNDKKLEEGSEDLVRYFPLAKRSEKDDSILEVSHLIVPVGQSLLALRRVLTLLFKELQGSTEVDQKFFASWLKDAEVQVIEKNISYYDDILACVKKHIEADGETLGLKNVLNMVEAQLKGLRAYPCLEG